MVSIEAKENESVDEFLTRANQAKQEHRKITHSKEINEQKNKEVIKSYWKEFTGTDMSDELYEEYKLWWEDTPEEAKLRRAGDRSFKRTFFDFPKFKEVTNGRNKN